VEDTAEAVGGKVVEWVEEGQMEENTEIPVKQDPATATCIMRVK